jgi:hypothetical protein
MLTHKYLPMFVTIVCFLNDVEYFTATQCDIAEDVNFQDVIVMSLPTD